MQLFAQNKSILGASKRLLTSSDNLNTLSESGVYSYINANNPQNAPYSANAVVIVNRFDEVASKASQVVIDYNYNKMFYRVLDYAAGSTPRNWQEVTVGMPSFYKNYSTFADLISAALSTIGNVSDANDAPIGICTLTSNGSHLPVPAQLLCLTLGGYNQRVQLAFRFINGEMYTRVYNGTAWESWYKIDTAIIQ